MDTQKRRAPTRPGQLLVLGFTFIALVLIVGVADGTAIQLAPARRSDATGGQPCSPATPPVDGAPRGAVLIRGIFSLVLTPGTSRLDGQTRSCQPFGLGDVPRRLARTVWTAPAVA